MIRLRDREVKRGRDDIAPELLTILGAPLRCRRCMPLDHWRFGMGLPAVQGCLSELREMVRFFAENFKREASGL